MKARANRPTRPLPDRRGGFRRRHGSATVEMALLAPILVVLVLWANYFWEVQRVRLKGAEMARYIAFERTVKANPAAIAAEAQERYKDLDGSTPTGELGTAYRNRLTLTVQAQDVSAPLHATAFLADLAASQMDLDPDNAAVETTIRMTVENGILPDQIALFNTAPDSALLNLDMQDGFHLVHDTWRAWKPGDDPNDSYPPVENNIHEHTSGIVYLGLGGNGAMNAIGDVLSVLGLDFPFTSSYIRASVMARPVRARGNFYNEVRMETRTVPGDILQARYYTSDDNFCTGGNCEPDLVRQKRGVINRGDRGDNWPMRSYNCRGPYFQGATRSQAPESLYSQEPWLAQLYGVNHGDYHRYGNNACQ